MTTKILIPRGSGEGGIGAIDSAWGQAYFDTGNFNKELFVSGKNIQQVVSDVVVGGGLGGVWDSGPAGVIYYNGGNVGIGTTDPEIIHHISTKSDATNYAVTRLQADTESFDVGVGGSNVQIQELRNKFYIWDDTSQLARLVVGSNGNVGIGTSSPITSLDIHGSLSFKSRGAYVSATNAGGDVSSNDLTLTAANSTNSIVARSAQKIIFQTFNPSLTPAPDYVERLRINNNGNVGIGTTNPTGLLEIRKDEDRNAATAHLKIMGGSGLTTNQVVTGSLYIDNGGPTSTVAKFYISQDITGGEVRIVSGSNGVKLTDGATAWTGISDETLKENISPLENVLDKIKDYRCVEYNLKESPEDKKIGFIAQDWVDDFNPIVHKDEEGLLGMKYTETIPVLLKAIQEQQQLIEDLKSRVKTLENK